MYPKEFPINLKDCSATEMLLAVNHNIIANAQRLVVLLQAYLKEQDEAEKQKLTAQIMLYRGD